MTGFWGLFRGRGAEAALGAALGGLAGVPVAHVALEAGSAVVRMARVEPGSPAGLPALRDAAEAVLRDAAAFATEVFPDVLETLRREAAPGPVRGPGFLRPPASRRAAVEAALALEALGAAGPGASASALRGE
ncbi:MAG: hypothetical protein L0216_04535, partial [Planctomycetales bacterium]|nr:hypothetical protein [Planctomycetales bacterium]